MKFHTDVALDPCSSCPSWDHDGTAHASQRGLIRRPWPAEDRISRKAETRHSLAKRADVPKRQVEDLTVRAARDFDAFYRDRLCPPEDTDHLMILSFDAKGIADPASASPKRPPVHCEPPSSSGDCDIYNNHDSAETWRVSQPTGVRGQRMLDHPADAAKRAYRGQQVM